MPRASAISFAVSRLMMRGLRADFGRGDWPHASHDHTLPTALHPIARDKSCCDNPAFSRIVFKLILKILSGWRFVKFLMRLYEKPGYLLPGFDANAMLTDLLEEHRKAVERIVEGVGEGRRRVVLDYASLDAMMEAKARREEVDDIEYYAYAVDDTFMSREEKYAYTLAECDEDLSRVLDSRIGAYIDMEKLGRDMAMEGCVSLMEDGYIDNSHFPDTGRYTYAEICEEAGMETAIVTA